MKKRLCSLILFYFTLGMLLLCIGLYLYSTLLSRPAMPKVQAGTLDFRDGMPKRTIPLEGTWEFYFGTLAQSDNLQALPQQARIYRQVPQKWASYPEVTAQIGEYGYATYRLRILLPQSEERLGLYLPPTPSNVRIFANGAVVYEEGNPTENPADFTQALVPGTAYFGSKDGVVDLVFHVSSQMRIGSGFTKMMRIGQEQAMRRFALSSIVIDAGMSFSFFILAAVFLSMVIEHTNKQSQLLTLALYCLVTGVYGMTQGENLLLRLFPSIPALSVFIPAKYLVLILQQHLLVRLAWSMGAPAKPLWGKSWAYIALVAAVALVIFSHVYITNSSDLMYAVATGFIMLYTVLSLLRQTRALATGRFYLYTAMVCMLAFTLAQMLILMYEQNHYMLIFQILFALSLAQYVNEQTRELYETLAALNEQLLHADRRKNEALSVFSQELRAPLDSIANLSLALSQAQGTLCAEQQNDLRLIGSISQHLNLLVLDLVDYAALSNNSLALNMGVVDIRATVCLALDICLPGATAGSVHTHNLLPPRTFFVKADKARLLQILLNLFANAYRHTTKGSVTITAREESGLLYLSIADTGSGMSAAQLRTLLDSSAADADMHSGASSLSLCRKLALLQGGDLSATSTPGKGSVFTLSLVLAPAPAPDFPAPIPLPDSGADKTAFEAGSGESGNILVVDDDYASLRTIAHTLSAQGYRLTCLGNPEEALTLLARPQLHYDLCILDARMPAMSGHTICKAVRGRFSALDLPIILLTASVHDRDIQAGFDAGANDLIAKPFNHTELIVRADTLIRLKRFKAQLLERDAAFLQAQIRPHFLFNALNTIVSYCHTDPLLAADLLGSLSSYLRTSFDFKSAMEPIPVKKELQTIKAYVDLEKARFGERLSVIYDIEPKTLDCILLPLTIQPLVENAIRHGASQDGRWNIRLCIHQKDGDLCVEVYDEGPGIGQEAVRAAQDSSPPERGIGLWNTKERLNTYFGRRLILENQSTGGLCVRFSIPILLR